MANRETEQEEQQVPVHKMGPWVAQLVSIFTYRGEGPIFTSMGTRYGKLAKELMERAVLCLNICQGITNEDLSRGRIQRRLRAEELMSDDLVAIVRYEIINEDMLTHHEVKKRVFGRKRPPFHDAIRKGRILELKVGHVFFYPVFQFLDNKLSETAANINLILEAKGNPWRAASWWYSPNSNLAGVKPCDLLGTDREPELVVLVKKTVDTGFSVLDAEEVEIDDSETDSVEAEEGEAQHD